LARPARERAPKPMTLRVPALLLGVFVAVTPNLHYFRYERPLLNIPAQHQQACLTLDKATFTHSGPQLSSLRLYRGDKETPYSLNYAAPAESSPETLTPLNAGLRGGVTTFDVAMPEGAYSNLDLGIATKNFIATVQVSGSQGQTSARPTKLGSYTIFDFTRQKLGRSTVLHLPLSDFRFLHFRIAGAVAPENVRGLTVLRASVGEPKYLTVAATSRVVEKGRDSIVEFSVPANTPVDRVVFEPGPGTGEFSRNVRVSVSRIAPPRASGSEFPEPSAQAFGNLLRIHRVVDGHPIDEERLAVNAPLNDGFGEGFGEESRPGAGTRWTVTIENGDDAPLPIGSV